jgi:hypothetical protein
MPLHFQLPSGRHLFLETLSVSMIKLVSFLNVFLWILAMVHNLLEQLVLFSFLVNLTQEVFSQKVVGDLLPFAIQELYFIGSTV